MKLYRWFLATYIFIAIMAVVLATIITINWSGLWPPH